jgi:hypothetical protein
MLMDDLLMLQFKEDPCKMVPISGWIVVFSDNALHPDLFTLTDPVRGELSSLVHPLQY